MHLTLSPVPLEAMGALSHGDSSRAIRARVEQARYVQRSRFGASARGGVNATAPRRALWRDADQGAKAVLSAASEALGLSARGFDRVLRVARTIADLEGSDGIREAHTAEAIRYRPR